MRRRLSQAATLVQRFVDQRNFSVLQVAQAPMNETARNCRATAAHVVLVENDDLQSAQGRIPGDTGTIDAGADNGKIECAFFSQIQGLTCPLPRTMYL